MTINSYIDIGVVMCLIYSSSYICMMGWGTRYWGGNVSNILLLIYMYDGMGQAAYFEFERLSISSSLYFLLFCRPGGWRAVRKYPDDCLLQRPRAQWLAMTTRCIGAPWAAPPRLAAPCIASCKAVVHA